MSRQEEQRPTFRFHTWIQRRPTEVTRTGAAEIEGTAYPVLEVPPEQRGHGLAVSFEEVGEALSRLERMFFEPDGSFVWVGLEPELWQLDGNLYDRAGQVVQLELKGRCPPEAFDLVLQTLGWPEESLMFELPQAGLFLDEQTFRDYASRRMD